MKEKEMETPRIEITFSRSLKMPMVKMLVVWNSIKIKGFGVRQFEMRKGESELWDD